MSLVLPGPPSIAATDVIRAERVRPERLVAEGLAEEVGQAEQHEFTGAHCYLHSFCDSFYDEL